MARTHVLEASQVVRRPRRDVFGFFADPENLDTITPDGLRFEILTPRPVAMHAGAPIAYRLRLSSSDLRVAGGTVMRSSRDPPVGGQRVARHRDPAFGLTARNAMGPGYAVAKAALNA